MSWIFKTCRCKCRGSFKWSNKFSSVPSKCTIATSCRIGSRALDFFFFNFFLDWWPTEYQDTKYLPSLMITPFERHLSCPWVSGYYEGEKIFYSFDLVKARVEKIGPLVDREEKSLEVFEVSPNSSTIAFVGYKNYILLISTKTKARF